MTVEFQLGTGLAVGRHVRDGGPGNLGQIGLAADISMPRSCSALAAEVEALDDSARVQAGTVRVCRGGRRRSRW